jgi:hypothetical protein
MTPPNVNDTPPLESQKDGEALELKMIETGAETRLSPEEDRRILRKIDMKYGIPTMLSDQIHRLNIG